MLKKGDRVLLFKRGKASIASMECYIGNCFTISGISQNGNICNFCETEAPFGFNTDSMIKLDDLLNISPEEFMKRYKESIDN